MGFIYKITSPSKKIYIGSTITIKKRWSYYRNLNCKKQPKLLNSFLKYGVDNHSFEIIEECENQVLFQRESFYGKLYDVLGFNGLNLSLPLTEGYMAVSESVKKKLSQKLKGRIFTDEWKQKISQKASKRVGSLNSAYGRKRPDFSINASIRDKHGDKNPIVWTKPYNRSKAKN